MFISQKSRLMTLMMMNNIDRLSVKVGDVVTVGLGTHDMEVKAWITFPELDVTHQFDLTTSQVQYEELPGGSNHYEKITVPSLHDSNHLKGQIKDIQECGMGGLMALVEIAPNRSRWFNPYLLNCNILES